MTEASLSNSGNSCHSNEFGSTRASQTALATSSVASMAGGREERMKSMKGKPTISKRDFDQKEKVMLSCLGLTFSMRGGLLYLRGLILCSVQKFGWVKKGLQRNLVSLMAP